jgi:O-antigen ligase
MLAYAFPLILSLVLKDKFIHKSNIFFASTGVLIFVALIFTAVRSAILGLLMGTLCTLFKIRKYKKGLMALLMTGMVFIFMVNFFDVSAVLDTITTFDDKSAVGRKPLFLTGLYIAKDNLLFGIGLDNFTYYSDHYYGKVYHLRGAESIAYLPPHNQFINVLVYYGAPGILLLSMFYVVIIKNLVVAQKKSMDEYCFHISAGLLGSHISYIFNSFFHNLGPFFSDPYAWFFIAATFICFKFMNDEQ